MDILAADNLYDGFCNYQTHLLEQFELMSAEYGFSEIDANRSVQDIFEDLGKHIRKLLKKGRVRSEHHHHEN
jgi:hypothetical protein